MTIKYLNIDYTQTYRETLLSTIDIIERAWGEKHVNRFLNELDEMVEKIRKYPFLFQEFPVNPKYRRCVLSKQTSLVYEINESKITLLYIFDNRQDSF